MQELITFLSKIHTKYQRYLHNSKKMRTFARLL